MSSSISNSKKSHGRSPRWRLAAACFTAAFGVLCVVGENIQQDARESAAYWRVVGRLDSTWRRTYRDGHYDFYWDRGDFIDHARRADIVILGNSRAAFAFRQEWVKPFVERSGLQVYNMTFSCSEGVIFPQRLIEKHDLRPRLVIVNADNFFTRTTSQLADWILAGHRVPDEAGNGQWGMIKYNFEDALTSRAGILVHSLLPRWEGVLPSGARPLRIHRSVPDGAWLLSLFDLRRTTRPLHPLGDEKPVELSASDRAVLDAFGAEMKRRGIRVVLTAVPRASIRRLEAVAEYLDAPSVIVRAAGLATIDGSHLDGDSARLFQEAFWRQLEESGILDGI